MNKLEIEPGFVESATLFSRVLLAFPSLPLLNEQMAKEEKLVVLQFCC
jgi:hypothetical protein